MSVFSRCLSQACMSAGHPATHHTSHRQPRPNLAVRADRAYAARQHAARHLLLSLTKQWLINERHLPQY